MIQRIYKDGVIIYGYGQDFLFHINGNPDLFIFKLYCHRKLLSEDINNPVTSDKPYQVNISGRDAKSGRKLKIFQ